MALYHSEKIGGGTDLSVFNDLNSFIHPSIFRNRISDYIGGYKKVGNLVYVYVSFYQINKNEFGEGHNYWALFDAIPHASENIVPVVICDPHGIFTAARIVNNNSVGQLNIIGDAKNYDNGKGESYTTAIKGVYLTE